MSVKGFVLICSVDVQIFQRIIEKCDLVVVMGKRKGITKVNRLQPLTMNIHLLNISGHI